MLEYEYRNEFGLKALIVSYATFYVTAFDNASTGYVEAYKLVLEHLRPHIRWYQTERMRRPKKVTDQSLEMFNNWFADTSRKREWYNLYLSSGEESDSAGPWTFDFSINTLRIPVHSGYFHFTMPKSLLDHDIPNFLGLVSDIADTMPFRSGHAGYGIHYDAGYELPPRNKQIYAWARKYACIDHGELPSASLYMSRYIKSVNWLTLLDYEFLNQIGGLDNLRLHLGGDITVEEQKQGIIIKLGSKPILGDVNRHEDVQIYRCANNAIKSLRTPEHLPFPGFNKDETQEWLARFDRI